VRARKYNYREDARPGFKHRRAPQTIDVGKPAALTCAMAAWRDPRRLVALTLLGTVRPFVVNDRIVPGQPNLLPRAGLRARVGVDRRSPPERPNGSTIWSYARSEGGKITVLFDGIGKIFFFAISKWPPLRPTRFTNQTSPLLGSGMRFA